MKEKFYEWCEEQSCFDCKYRNFETSEDCYEQYRKDNLEDVSNDNIEYFKTIESKIDVIVKHLGISIDWEGIMMQGFEEWCATRHCSECKYDKLGNMKDCINAFEEDMKVFKLNGLQSIEKKLDAIMKYFEISLDEEINI